MAQVIFAGFSGVYGPRSFVGIYALLVSVGLAPFFNFIRKGAIVIFGNPMQTVKCDHFVSQFKPAFLSGFAGFTFHIFPTKDVNVDAGWCFKLVEMLNSGAPKLPKNMQSVTVQPSADCKTKKHLEFHWLITPMKPHYGPR